MAKWLAHLIVKWEVTHSSLATFSAETHTCEKWLADMLAIYTGKGVATEVNFREHISHISQPGMNKAAYPVF